MPKHETRNTLLNNLGSKHSLVMKFGQFIKNSVKNVAWKLVPVYFYFQRILCKKDSAEVSMLISTNFDRFAITFLI